MHKDPNERPKKPIAQQPKVVEIIEQEDKQLRIEPISESTPSEKKDENIEEIVVSNDVQKIHEYKSIIANKKKDIKYENIYSVVNSTIDGLIYRINTVVYAIVLVLFYGGSGIWLVEIIK